MTKRREPTARELSLVAFTVLAQAGAGILLLAVLPMVLAGGDPARRPALLASSACALSLLALAAALSLLHLGKPLNAPRTLANLRESWLSREILFLGLSGGMAAAVLFLVWSGAAGRAVLVAMAVLAALAGMLLVLSMSRIYRLDAVPVWKSAMTPFSFFMTSALAGTLGAALAGEARWAAPVALGLLVADLAVVALADPSYGFFRKQRGLAAEGPRSIALLHGLRLAFLLAGSAAAATVLFMSSSIVPASNAPILLVPALSSALASEVVGRVLFYSTFRKSGL